jgi:hypothetical protein
MSQDISHTAAAVGATTYVMHMLLQRLETTHPGLVLDMLEGARLDQAAVQAKGTLSEPLAQVFEQAIGMLELVDAQNRQAPGGADSPA